MEKIEDQKSLGDIIREEISKYEYRKNKLTVEPVDSKEEATHRYPTSVHWGKGYFDDGFRYVVANSIRDVLVYTAGYCEFEHIQVKNGDKWEFAK